MEKRSDSLGQPIARDAFDCAEVLVLLCAAQPCDAERAAHKAAMAAKKDASKGDK